MTDFPISPPHVPRLKQNCYLVICRDGPNSAGPRQTHLKGHLDHVEANWTRYVTAGPLREPGKDALAASAFLVLADTLEDAKTLMNGDPYLTCGMYESVEYKEMVNSIGQYMGGKIWENADALVSRAAGGAANEISNEGDP